MPREKTNARLASEFSGQMYVQDLVARLCLAGLLECIQLDDFYPLCTPCTLRCPFAVNPPATASKVIKPSLCRRKIDALWETREDNHGVNDIISACSFRKLGTLQCAPPSLPLRDEGRGR